MRYELTQVEDAHQMYNPEALEAMLEMIENDINVGEVVVLFRRMSDGTEEDVRVLTNRQDFEQWVRPFREDEG